MNDVEVNGFNTRKDCALLAYLAVTGTTHSRATLANLLWPELPKEKARSNLRHTLSHLQKVIGPEWLTLEHGVGLAQEQPWSVDVHRLRTILKTLTVSPAMDSGLAERQTLESLEQVLEVYRGEFLQGFHVREAAYFEEWVVAQREELRLLTLRVLEMLGERALAQGAYMPGLTATHRMFQLEPWSEPAHCLHMQLLAHSGQRAEALAHYEICRKLLATELGVEPLPTTTALYQQIQAGQYSQYSRVITIQQSSSLQPAGAPRAGLQDVSVLQPVWDEVVNGELPPHNLLAPLAEFSGRQRELAFISQRLATPDCRLLTITGPGGMGKTSLALAAGKRLLATQGTDFPDGLFFVSLLAVGSVSAARNELAPADDPVVGEAVLYAIAEQIGYKLEPGVSPAHQLQAYLHRRRLLLILDNFEHLLAGTDAVLTLLVKAPQLKILITSRARLNLRGESVLALAKLSLPTAAYAVAVATAQANPAQVIQNEVWQTSEAVTMFVQRAQQFDPSFTINSATIGPVGRICQFVEGLPLGIELATSMLPLISCTQLAQELAQSLDFLAADIHDLPGEQRTLGAVFERSWLLLPPEGQLLLAKLSIFPSSFDRAAAESIAGASIVLLCCLLDQSLVNKVGDERYSLHRTVHAFAQQKRQAWPEQSPTLQRQFAHYYLAFLARGHQQLRGTEHAVTTEQIQAELDNVRQAWHWAVTYGLVTDLRNCIDVFFLVCDQQGFYLEAAELYDHALRVFVPLYEAQPHKVGTDLTWLVGRLQSCYAVCHSRLGRFAQAQAAYEASWAIWQQEDNPTAAAICLGHWGTWLRGSDTQRSAVLLTEAWRLVQVSGGIWLRALISQVLGETIFLLGDYAAAETYITKGLTLAQQINWPRGLISGYKALGRVNLLRGCYHEAEEQLRTSVELAQRYQFKLLGIESQIALGEALRLQGALAEASACFAQSRQAAEALGATALIAFARWEEGCLAEQCAEYEAAKALFTESLVDIALAPWWSHALPTLGWALIGLGELAAAQTYFQKVLTEAQARLPILLDAQIGLAYLTALEASTEQWPVETPTEPLSTVFQRVYGHPAATAETRNRMTRLAAKLSIPLVCL